MQLHHESTQKEEKVPTISYFFGIIIRMYHDDHAPPHFHAEYQGYRAMIKISDGEVLKGKLPNKAKQLIKEWCLLHQTELLDNWERAINFKPLEKIIGADND